MFLELEDRDAEAILGRLDGGAVCRVALDEVRPFFTRGERGRGAGHWVFTVKRSLLLLWVKLWFGFRVIQVVRALEREQRRSQLQEGWRGERQVQRRVATSTTVWWACRPATSRELDHK